MSILLHLIARFIEEFVFAAFVHSTSSIIRTLMIRTLDYPEWFFFHYVIA